ncbi:3-ketoacyl-ACP reductase [Nanobdella aerobiophila]|uniref:3-ketoacyl-ACP reductase n=1 Tax=Nanobdella aerobiophila TaxID=2586965 RepID=A0A915WSF7_9ARCH|nr:SDR family oxidoreductase [Nanobdella aerobiophila]BBL45250.1 3-ketoacyl-ACP reductase [Nanobdella aerobiophila]
MNKKILIIGVSKGFGYALAYFLLKRNFDVVLVSRNRLKLEEIKAKLSKYGNIEIIDADVGSREAIKYVKEKIGNIDGIAISIGGYFEDNIYNIGNIDELINNNIKYPIYIINELLDSLRNNSTILLVSNSYILNRGKIKENLSYSISKAANAKLVDILSSELIDKNIRVVGIAPGTMEGDFEPERDYKKLRKIGEPRGTPEDIAVVASWLFTEEAEWINGVVIPVDGGYNQ